MSKHGLKYIVGKWHEIYIHANEAYRCNIIAISTVPDKFNMAKLMPADSVIQEQAQTSWVECLRWYLALTPKSLN